MNAKDESPEPHVGRRVRQLRVWRRLTQRQLAGFAGMSQPNLSNIERGYQPVERKATLEALAAALEVSPSDLMGQPFPPSTPEDARGQAAVDMLRATLRRVDLGDVEVDPSLIDGLGARVRSARVASVSCDYEALADVLPALTLDAFGLANAGSAQAAELLVPTLRMVFQLLKDLGYHDVAWNAVGHAHRAALAHGDPAWLALLQFDRARGMVGADARAEALRLVNRTADQLDPDGGRVGEAYGMLRLSAALQCSIAGDLEAVEQLVADAADVARHTGEGTFGDMHFGPRNLALWRLTFAVEAGDLGRVPELAAAVDVDAIPSTDRRAMYHVELGRGLAERRGSETGAVAAFRRAEHLAAPLVHAHPFAREAIGDLLRRARRDAGGVELRGMAHRMGLGV